MSIDFDKIRRDYPLPDIIIASGVSLKKNGNEFEALCPFHGEKTASFQVYQKAGIWKFHCKGCNIAGSNLDYVIERYGCKDVTEAAAIITGDEQRAPRTAAQYKELANPYTGYDVGRPPADAPEIRARVKTPPLLNPKRVNTETGEVKYTTYRPTMAHPYRTRTGDLLGYVLRVDFDDKKITPGIWWMKNAATGFEGWAHGSYPDPRPLYRLDQVTANPDDQILIVEGEKCADVAAEIFASNRVTPASWMGGGKSIHKTYWKDLAGRSVILWPDNDDEGWNTILGYWLQGSWHRGIIEHLFSVGVGRVKIVNIRTDARKKGWDIADAKLEDNLTDDAIKSMLRERVEEWPRARFDAWKAAQIDAAMGREQEPQPAREPSTPAQEKKEAEEDEPKRRAVTLAGNGFIVSEDNWRNHLIMKADGGLKSTSLQNAGMVLQFDRQFADIFAWNDFAKEIYLMRRPPWDMTGNINQWSVRKISDPDVTALAMMLEYWGLSMKTNDIGKVITRIAEHNKFNAVSDALEALVWDGHPRLMGGEHGLDFYKPWMTQFLGADDTPINRAFGVKWMVGACARAYHPGCKLDTMLILEGAQGARKSTALRILSDAVTPGVFTDEMSDPNSKDAALQMQGAWIIEIAELDALGRAEVNAIKAWLSRREDRFRRPYGKVVEDFPRTCAFAGTVNPLADSGYLKDPTGGRRFWPVTVKDIDLEGLKLHAQQLWAEAYAMMKRGDHWWLTQQEEQWAAAVQAERLEQDPFAEMIDEFITGRTSVTVNQIMQSIEIPRAQRSQLIARRVISHLAVRGWKQQRSDRGSVFISPLALAIDAA